MVGEKIITYQVYIIYNNENIQQEIRRMKFSRLQYDIVDFIVETHVLQNSQI